MDYPVLVNPRKPSLSRMPMKKPKRATAAKAKKGRKTSGSRTKTASKRAAAPRRAPTARAAKKTSKETSKDTSKDTSKAAIRGLRTKLTQALRRVAELEAAADTDFLLDIPNRRGFERELQRAVA